MIITDENSISSQRAGAPIHDMDLVIEQTDPLEIAVRAGSLRFEGVDTGLDQDESFALTTRPTAAQIIGYVVQDKQDNDAIHVFVDEILLDEEDEAFVFNHQDRYKLLAYLYRAVIPANTSDLTDVPLTRYTIKNPQE